MNSKLTSCPVCSEKFDLEARIPMCLPECGHTLCKLCCAKIAARFVQRCPLDKKWLRDTPKINNYALMNLQSIQEYHKDHEPCLQHKEKLKLLCLTDNVRICVDCHCIGEHQGHKIVHLGNIKQKLTKKKKMLEKSLENLDKHSTCMQNELKEAQNDVKGIVEGFLKKRGSKFQQLRKGTLEGLKASFDKEKKRIEGIFGKDSQFSAFLKKKIQDCSESDMNNPNLMQIVDEDMDQLLKRCDSTHFKESIEEYANELNTVKDQMKQTVVKGKDQKLDFESLIKEFSLKQLAKQNDFGDFSGLVQVNSDV